MEVIFGFRILENIKFTKKFHAAEKKIIFADLCYLHMAWLLDLLHF
jgi:hypothetical protein